MVRELNVSKEEEVHHLTCIKVKCRLRPKRTFEGEYAKIFANYYQLIRRAKKGGLKN